MPTSKWAYIARDSDSYTIELRFSQPESDADIRLVRGDPSLVQFDMERLRALTLTKPSMANS